MKRIALINDLSGFGKCSLTAAIPVISIMGIQACPLPTAILSAQTGFDSYFFDDYTDHMSNYAKEWVKMGVDFDGIYSGYLGSPLQVEHVLNFLEKFKKDKTIFLADPVMGDNGRCIKSFSGELLNTMKTLTQKADVITPNLTELCLLADVDFATLSEKRDKDDYLDRVTEVAYKVKRSPDSNQTVIVTGIIRNGNKIGNLVLEDSKPSFYEGHYTGKSFSGTGDLFASTVIGSIVKGKSATEAVQTAMGFLQPAIEEAGRENIPENHGVYFEKYLPYLSKDEVRI